METFNWMLTIPPLMGALVGAAAAIGTQIWQGSRQRALNRQARLEAAVDAAIEAIDEVGKRAEPESDLLIYMHHRITILRGWALRSGRLGFSGLIEEILRRLHASTDRDSMADAAAMLSIVCTMWLEDDLVFERRGSPKSLAEVPR